MDLNILGIGPLEVVVFVVILLLLFGPKDLVGMARNIGRFLNRLVRSENYQVIQQASTELRKLPERLVQEAQLEELQQTLKPQLDDVQKTIQPALNEIQQAVSPAPSPRLRSAPPAASAPAKPVLPAFAAWTQELPPAGEPPAAFQAWTQELPPEVLPPADPPPAAS